MMEPINERRVLDFVQSWPHHASWIIVTKVAVAHYRFDFVPDPTSWLVALTHIIDGGDGVTISGKFFYTGDNPFDDETSTTQGAVSLIALGIALGTDSWKCYNVQITLAQPVRNGPLTYVPEA